MDQLGLTIDTNMALHAKVPFIAFVRLVHLRVTLALFVFGRSWRINDGRTHNRASTDLQTVVSSGAGSLPKSMPTNCRMAHESYNASSNRGIGKVEPVLQKMNTQHPLQSNRRAACTLSLRIERLDYFAQIAPRYDLIHLQQKRLPTRSFAKTFESIIGERLLAQCKVLRAASNDDLYDNQSMNKSELP